ncbi:MAG: DUF934 domain-containing protein [Gammaproteobacteria bacterium]|nr:MAG: DUF934 domain-containing protein [Gammaproteobacteria bacterium]
MPTLIKHDKITQDDWELVEAQTPVNGARRIVPVDAWLPESGDGLLLPGDAEPDARFCEAPLIAINFAVFSDGRGLSLAVLLRTRFDFTGELRAVGDVHPELLYYLNRCGFDSYLLPDGRSAQTALSTLAPYTDYYQASVLEPNPSHRRIRRFA